MREDTTIPFTNPAFRDELRGLVREGAQRIIRQAEEVELGIFLEEHSIERNARGHRNGIMQRLPTFTGGVYGNRYGHGFRVEPHLRYANSF